MAKRRYKPSQELRNRFQSRRDDIKGIRTLERKRHLTNQLEQKVNEIDMSFREMDVLVEAINTSVIETLGGLDGWIDSLKSSEKTAEDVLTVLEEKIKSAIDQFHDLNESGQLTTDIVSEIQTSFKDVKRAAMDTISQLSNTDPILLKVQYENPTEVNLTPNLGPINDALNSLKPVGVDLIPNLDVPEISDIPTPENILPTNQLENVTQVINQTSTAGILPNSEINLEQFKQILSSLSNIEVALTNVPTELSTSGEKILPQTTPNALDVNVLDNINIDDLDVAQVLSESLSGLSDSFNETITAELDRSKLILDDINSLSSDILNTNISLTSSSQDYGDNLTAVTDGLIKQIKFNSENVTLIQTQLDALENILNTHGDILGLSSDETQSLRELLAYRKEELKHQQTYLQIFDKKVAIVQKFGSIYRESISTVSKGLDEYGTKITDFISGLPGGKFIADKLNFDQVSQQFDQIANEGFANFITKVNTEGVGAFRAMGSTIVGIGRSLITALGPIGLVSAAVFGLYSAFKSVLDKTREISDSFGTSLEKSKDLLQQSYKIQSSELNRLSTNADILATMKELRDVWNTTHGITNETVASVSDIGKAMGIGVQSSAKLYSTISKLGADKELAAKMELVALKAAEASGFSAQMITDEIIDNADTLEQYFYGMPQQMVKTVLEVKKLGMSISQVSKISDHLLDIESSLTSQFEASAVLGRAVNLEKARQYAFEGNMLGVAQEITREVGSSADLAKMNVYQRKLLAKSMGIEVSEMANIVAFNEKTAKLTKEQKDEASKYMDKLGDISSLTQSEFDSMLGQMTVQDEMSAKWDKIKIQFAQALIPLAESFAGMLSSLMPILDLVVAAFKPIGAALKFIAGIVSGLLAPFKIIGTIVESIAALFKKSESSVEVLSAGVGDIKEQFSGISGILGGIIGVLAAPKLFGNIFRWLGKLIGIGKAAPAGGVVSQVLGEVNPSTLKKFSLSNLFNFSGIFKGMSGILPKIAGIFSSIIKMGLSTGLTLGKNILAGVTKYIPKLKGIGSTLSTLAPTILPKMNISKVAPILGKLKESIKTKFEVSKPKIVTPEIPKVKSNVDINFSNITSKLSDLKGKIGGIFTTLSTKFSDTFSIAIKSITAAAGKLSGILRNAFSVVKNLKLPKLSLPKINLPKLPKLGLPKIALPKLSAPKISIPKMPTRAVADITGTAATKAVPKVAAKTAGRGILKSIAKKIPGIGLLMGAGFAVDRLLKGDAIGAGGELLSGLAGTIPGIGTAASLGIDAALMARDYSKSKTADQQKPNLTEGVTKSMEDNINTITPNDYSSMAMDPSRKITKPIANSVSDDSTIPAANKIKQPEVITNMIPTPERVTDTTLASSPVSNITNNYLNEGDTISEDSSNISTINNSVTERSPVVPKAPVIAPSADSSLEKTPNIIVNVSPPEVNIPANNTAKLEALMIQLLEVMKGVANTKTYAILSDQTVETLNTRLRSKNAQ